MDKDLRDITLHALWRLRTAPDEVVSAETRILADRAAVAFAAEQDQIAKTAAARHPDEEILAVTAIDLWRGIGLEDFSEFLSQAQITALERGLIRADAEMGYPS